MSLSRPADLAFTAAPEPVFSVYRLHLEDSASYNLHLGDAFERLANSPDTHRSHLFNGRYENIYPPRKQLPEIEPLIRTVEDAGRRILQRNGPLRTGFWFNRMNPGDVTTLHCHDDDDELLSAVYYLSTPSNSGRLLFHEGGSTLAVTPVAGTLLMFTPDLPHEVERHRGEGTRLSVAFNIGPGETG